MFNTHAIDMNFMSIANHTTKKINETTKLPLVPNQRFQQPTTWRRMKSKLKKKLTHTTKWKEQENPEETAQNLKFRFNNAAIYFYSVGISDHWCLLLVMLVLFIFIFAPDLFCFNTILWFACTTISQASHTEYKNEMIRKNDQTENMHHRALMLYTDQQHKTNNENDENTSRSR